MSQQLDAPQTHTTDTFLFISHTTNVLVFKFRCNIFIGVRIIKEMPGSVASGTLCTIQVNTGWAESRICEYINFIIQFRQHNIKVKVTATCFDLTSHLQAYLRTRTNYNMPVHILMLNLLVNQVMSRLSKVKALHSAEVKCFLSTLQCNRKVFVTDMIIHT